MITLREHENLQWQASKLRELWELAKDDPFMGPALEDRLAEAEARASEPFVPEPEVVVLFHGKPVHGSRGIDVAFAGKVLEPFQNMVFQEYQARFAGKNASARKRNELSKMEAGLAVTALAHGSFGFRLRHLNTDNLYNDLQLSEVMQDTARLLQAATAEQEEYENRLAGFSIPTVDSMKSFLDVLFKSNAGVAIETGIIRAELKKENVGPALERLKELKQQQDDVVLDGIFGGFQLGKHSFEFIRDDGRIEGKIDPTVDVRQQQAYLSFYNQPSRLKARRLVYTFGTGNVKTKYTFLGLLPVE